MEVTQTDVQDSYCVFEVTLNREEIEMIKYNLDQMKSSNDTYMSFLGRNLRITELFEKIITADGG